MYIFRNTDGNAAHFLPVVKCTLICCATQSEERSIFRPLKASTQLIGWGRKGWLTGLSNVYFILSLCCLLRWLMVEAQRQAVERANTGESSVQSSWSPHNMADGPPPDWKHLFYCRLQVTSEMLHSLFSDCIFKSLYHCNLHEELQNWNTDVTVKFCHTAG